MNIESKCILILGWVTFSITVRIVVLLVLSETKPMMQGGGVIEQLDVDGHVIYIGSKVNIQWRGVWYDGTVIKIGPKRNLCKVRDLVTDKTLLMAPKQLKFMEIHALKRNFTQGTHVAYNDGDQWMEGVVEKENAVGAALVRWRKSIHAAETDSWFELVNIAPVIRNEAYLTHNNDDELEAGRSGLFQNNMIEPHPRTVQNTLYKSDDEFEDSGSPDHRSHSPLRTHRKNYTDYVEEPHHFTIHTSPTYESIASPNPLDSPIKQSPKHRPLPSPPHSPYAGTIQPPMVFPHIVPYRNDWSRNSNIHNRYPSQHHKPPMRKNLQHTSIPVAWTYKAHYRNGIPPHRSSNFFKRFKSHHSLQRQGHPNSGLKQSPSVISKTHSEPVPFAFQPAGRNIIPPRDVSKTNVKQRLFKERKWGWRKSSSKTKKQEVKTAPEPLPYEIPLEMTQTLSEVGEIEEDKSIASDSSEKRRPSLGDLSGNVNTKSRNTSPKRHNAPPTVASASPSKLNVNTGGHLLLTCVAKSAKPASYEWSKEGSRISMKSDDNLSVPSPGMLEIKKATLEDAGEYICTVRNENGSVTKSFKVYVVEDFFSVFSSSPSKLDSGLQTKFTSRVTVDELNLKQQEPPVDLSVQEFLNEIVEDIHISDDDMDLADLGAKPDDEYKIRKPADGKESSDIESDLNEKEEQNDVVHDLPTIVVTSEHVPEKQVRRRHSVMRNDMEQYLEGYGEDYGALSSATNLEQEGLKHYKAREIAKKTKAEHKKEIKTSSAKPKSKRFLRFPKFHKTTKTEIEVQDLTHDAITTDKNEIEMRTVEVEVHVTEQNPDKEDENSIAVNTSLGSTESLIAGVEEDGGHVTLPLEIETVTDQVRRLQQSLQEYEDESLLVQGGKKKGVFSSIFSSKVK